MNPKSKTSEVICKAIVFVAMDISTERKAFS
jgi:hypothetical protein